MTDYEQALTVAIKALSELIEDNRRLAGKLELLELAYEGCTGHKPDYKSLSNLYSKDGATIETLRESKDCPKSNQSKPFYGIRIDSLTNEIESAYHEYVGATISTSNAYKIAQHLSDCANSFIIL